MDFLYLLEGIRTPFLDTLMSLITLLGDETAFMAIGACIYWCVSKKHGYYLLCTVFMGTIINQFLKLTFRIPRPWVRDPSFTIVESAREAASGYSFPSGHTQNAVSTFGATARFSKHTLLRVICILLAAAIAFSRMYLGVHTPLDVGVSILIGLVLIFVLYPLFDNADKNPRKMYITLSVMLILAVVYTLYTELHAWPSDIDSGNLASGIKNGYTLSGAVCGLLLAYHLDVRYIHFSTKAPLWAQFLKLALGLALTLVIRIVLKDPLLALFGGHNFAHLVRYFIMIVFAAAVWPMTFGWFSRGCRKSK